MKEAAKSFCKDFTDALWQVFITIASAFFYCVWFVCLICMGIFTALKGMTRVVKTFLTQDVRDETKAADYMKECISRIINW